MLRSRACLRLRTFAQVTASRHPLHLRTASHTVTPTADSGTLPPTPSNGDLKSVEGQHQLQSSAEATLTPIKIYGPKHHHVRNIRRSFPKGKPENLIHGLEQLVSSAHHDEQGAVTLNTTPWKLPKDGDTIALFLAIENTEMLDKILQAIEAISQTMNHHPHHAHAWVGNMTRWIFGILCTTHRPPGLSLKDVKVAQEINKLVQEHADQAQPMVRVYTKGSKPIVRKLMWHMSAQARIATRDNTARAMRERGEEVNDQELDQQFEVTESLRKEVDDFQKNMDRRYAEAQLAKNDPEYAQRLKDQLPNAPKKTAKKSAPKSTKKTPRKSASKSPKKALEKSVSPSPTSSGSDVSMSASAPVPINVPPTVIRQVTESPESALRHGNSAWHKKRKQLERGSMSRDPSRSMSPESGEVGPVEDSSEPERKHATNPRIRYHKVQWPGKVKGVPVRIVRVT